MSTPPDPRSPAARVPAAGDARRADVRAADDLRISVPSDPARLREVREAVERLAGGHRFDDRAVGEIGLCVNEAMANVIRHAYAGRRDQPVAVFARVSEPDGTLTIELRDWGVGINPLASAPRRRDPNRPGGLGLICLREWMDDVHYAPQPDGMLLTMLRKRTAPGGPTASPGAPAT